MDYREIEKKWQKKWTEDNIYKFDESNLDKKFYMLEMFSYPSAAKLHLGHWWNYGLSDCYARFKRMQGYNVFHPMGFDSFGLPAENYAIKTGIHPKESTESNIRTMEEQLKSMGATFNWEYEIATHTPKYFKWTQWLFLKLFENGLAYQKYSPVNWCTKCNTVLANEQVVDMCCERCGSQVIKKDLTQWFFKITDYCEELLEGLNRINFPEKTKIAQRNWIGKSIGGEIVFNCENGEKITVFTSRADTLYGVSFVVIAPENTLVEKLTTPENKEAVEKYKYEASIMTEIDRTSTTKEKTGVFTGSYCINPLTNEKVPIFVADYVLNTYGTGAVMGVGAHDERDFVFAQKYNLLIKQVIEPKDGSKCTLPYCEYGKLVNSEEFNGQTSEEAKENIIAKLNSMNAGNPKVNYKLRDWSISRQRYWGCPIPIIHCPTCGAVAVPYEQLPVTLPHDVEWTPDGKSPLSKHKEYINTTCPKCGGNAQRDTDTLDAYLCSSWYHLRYPNANNENEAFNSDFTNKLLPVDMYVGGMEHATGHLLYIRFITKFLNKIGYLNFDEPVKTLIHQGMILGEDGQKMSKSRGNTVSADDLISEYGSDALRLYLMFGFNYVEGGPWTSDGIKSSIKFMERVERMITKVNDYSTENSDKYAEDEKALDYARHYAIKEISRDFEVFSFNTCIARMMELVNAIYKYDNLEVKNTRLMKEVCKDVVLLIASATPHFAEELWQIIGQEYSIFNEKLPTYDESKLQLDSIEIALQINSKIIDRINVPTNVDDETIKEIALNNEKTKQIISGKQIVKAIVVKNKLINFIVK